MSENPSDPEYGARIRASFARQGLMVTLGATLGAISPGFVEIALLPNPAISQQHGFVHGGAVSAIADTAAGYAALSLMPPHKGVLTTEFKINLLAPAIGDRIVARGRVVKAGRTLTVAQAEVYAETAGQEKLIALLTATLMSIEGKRASSTERQGRLMRSRPRATIPACQRLQEPADRLELTRQVVASGHGRVCAALSRGCLVRFLCGFSICKSNRNVPGTWTPSVSSPPRRSRTRRTATRRRPGSSTRCGTRAL